MANIVAVAYPDVYAALGILAGGPYSLGFDSTPDAGGQAIVAEMGARARAVPVVVMQGTNDNVNPYAAAEAAVQQWLGAYDLIDDGQANGSVSRAPSSEETHTTTGTPDPARSTTCDQPCIGGALGLDSYPFTVAHHAGARGRPLLDFWTVYGANHDYTGASGGSFTDPTGPSMTDGAYAFLMAHRLAR
jgi:poly(3-hydroxybutyrate) depolymerase